MTTPNNIDHDMIAKMTEYTREIHAVIDRVDVLPTRPMTLGDRWTPIKVEWHTVVVGPAIDVETP